MRTIKYEFRIRVRVTFTFHPGSMRTEPHAPKRVRGRTFTFHPGSMRTHLPASVCTPHALACLHSTLVQCGLLRNRGIRPANNFCLHSTLVQCGLGSGHHKENQLSQFTFHPGSMRTMISYDVEDTPVQVYIPPWFNADKYFADIAESESSVYIPPWFNADQDFLLFVYRRIYSLHSTLVQCGPEIAQKSMLTYLRLHSTLVQCGLILELYVYTVERDRLHSTLVQCGPPSPALTSPALTSRLHSTLVQCGQRCVHSYVIHDCRFTFHPGSMRTISLQKSY